MHVVFDVLVAVSLFIVLFSLVTTLRVRRLRIRIERKLATHKPFPGLAEEYRPAVEAAQARVKAKPGDVDAVIAELAYLPEPSYTQVAQSLRFEAALASGKSFRDAALASGNADLVRRIDEHPEFFKLLDNHPKAS